MPTVVKGQFDPKFVQLQAEFERNFSDRGESGASVCLSVNGETMVDLWGGVANQKTGELWERDTVSIVFSCTKAATALCAHILIDRGLLDLHGLVTDYWPEYGKHGKDNTTVAMMLNHESGVPAFREPIKLGGFNDWDYMISRLENEKPFWEPGTRNGYHMVSFGWTVGELVRRVSGKSLGTFFADEVAGPTGADFWIGIPDSFSHPIAPMIPYSPIPDDIVLDFGAKLMADPTSVQALSFLNTGGWKADNPESYRAEIGGAGGISNARGQVAMYEPLAKNDGSLVSPECLKNMSLVSTATQQDFTLLLPTRFGPGFMKSLDNRQMHSAASRQSVILGDQAFGHVGAGGSIGFADPECGLAFSYTMTKMGNGLLLNDRGQSLVDAAYLTLGYKNNKSGVWIK
ncbi:MAG: CubicO group peptidase (beta-lactamase class C family) [Paraglaciecola sp.]|jgi:CubicO group peptidase (beta-lactamase class C family)